MTASVVIPAHNEGSVIGYTLDCLLAGVDGSDVTVVVVANGCTDDTVQQAASRDGVLVLDVPGLGKPGALDAGELVVEGFPRIYLDADIAVPSGGLRALTAVLEAPGGPLAAVPARRIELSGRPWPVRAYFAVNQQLPAFGTGLFGRGMIGLSREGRQRFGKFPDVIADDLFLDSLFNDTERKVVADVVVTVEAPWGTRDLVQRLIRVRRGNSAMRSRDKQEAGHGATRPADRTAFLRVTIRRPWLAPAAVVYAALTVWAAVQARRSSNAGPTWERDESTRSRSGLRRAADA